MNARWRSGLDIHQIKLISVGEDIFKVLQATNYNLIKTKAKLPEGEI